jgi:DNA-binding beta-propeller fold protein YncE
MAFKRSITYGVVATVLLAGLGGGVAAWVLAAAASPVLHTVPVRTGPVAVAVDAQTGHVFVATTSATNAAAHYIGTGSVTVLDARRGVVLRRVVVDASGTAVAVDEATHRAFVAAAFLPPYTPAFVGNVLRVLDTRSGALVRTVHVGNVPLSIAVDERTNRVFVATLGPVNQAGVSLGHGQVAVLDARTGALLHTVTVGVSPRALVVARTTGRVFVPNLDSRSMSILDARTGTLLRTVPLGLMPCDSGADLPCTAAAVDEKTRRVFVAGDTGTNSFTGLVRVLDARSGAILRSMTIKGRPYAAAVDERTGHAFITNLGDATVDGTVLMLNARTGAVLRTITVGGTPLALACWTRVMGRSNVRSHSAGALAACSRWSSSVW